MHHWRSEGSYRRASCSEDSGNTKHDEEFRGRSRSMDDAVKKPVLTDCETTYRIYNKILKEGMLKMMILFVYFYCIRMSIRNL